MAKFVTDPKEAQYAQDKGSNQNYQDNVVGTIVDTLSSEIGPNWPTKSLFWGNIVSVEWDDGGGEHLDSRPITNSNQDVAIGNGQVGAIAALTSTKLGGSNRAEMEEILTALGLGVIDRIEQLDSDSVFDQAIHSSTFHTIPGASDIEGSGADTKEYAGAGIHSPKGLNILITNSRRSTRYGEDGAHDENGRLMCRIELLRSPFRDYGGEISDIEIESLPNAAIPSEIEHLHQTCFYFGLAGTLTRLRETGTAQDIDFNEKLRDFADGREPIRALNSVAANQVSTQDWYFNPISKFLRCPIAINTWTQAWIPMQVNYELELHPLSKADWSLGQFDFDLNGVAANKLSGSPITVNGQSFLFGKSGAIFSSQINELIEELEDTGADMTALENLNKDLLKLDMLTATITCSDIGLSEVTDSILDSAILDVINLQIVDAFGQTINLSKANGLNPSVAISLETDADDRYALMRPRLPTSSTLHFDFLSAQDDSVKSTLEISPVSGFLLPDHIEWAMEVFSNTGDALGQIRVAKRDWTLGGYQSGRLVWDSSPGLECQAGTSIDSGNSHLDGIISEIMSISLEDEIVLQENKRTEGDQNTDIEGAFSAWMRCIDNTLSNNDPLGKQAEFLPALFSGKPIAVVRAELRLDYHGVQLPESEMNELLEIRLGSLTRSMDGLLGYYLENDYTKFYSVLNDGLGTEIGEIKHEYIKFDETVEFSSSNSLKLTLLMEPQSIVTGTCGFLPQKEVALAKEHWESAISKMAPTFKFGPLLMDPKSVKLHVPDLMKPVDWSWISRPSTTEISVAEVAPFDGKAYVPTGRIDAWNGWIKLDPKEDSTNN